MVAFFLSSNVAENSGSPRLYEGSISPTLTLFIKKRLASHHSTAGRATSGQRKEGAETPLSLHVLPMACGFPVRRPVNTKIFASWFLVDLSIGGLAEGAWHLWLY